MDEITQLKNRVKLLEEIIAKLNFSDRYIFHKKVQFLNNTSIIAPERATGSDGDGLKIGTSATQGIGFFGVDPVVKQGPIGSDPGFATINGTGDDTDLNANFQAIISWNDDLVAGLHNLGLFS